MFDWLELFTIDGWVDRPGTWLWRNALAATILIGVGFAVVESDVDNVGELLMVAGMVPLIGALVNLSQIVFKWISAAAVWGYGAVTGQPRSDRTAEDRLG